MAMSSDDILGGAEETPTRQSVDADGFLTGGRAPSAKFPEPGTRVGGKIVYVGKPEQQRDFTSGKPKFWDDGGDPMMQLPVEVQTDEKDEDFDDDGTRTLYLKGAMLKAVRTELKRLRASGLREGGELYITYTRDGQPKQRGFNPPKEYDADYTPPKS